MMGGRRLSRGFQYERVRELRNLSDQELVSKHDAVVDHANGLPAMDKTPLLNRAQVYADELTRRETERLTKSLNRLTLIIVVATIIGVALTAWSLLSG